MSKGQSKVNLIKCRNSCSSMVGLTYALISAVCYATSGLIIKFLQNAGAGEALLLRYSMQYFVMLPFFSQQRTLFVRREESRPMFLIITVTFCTISVMAFFFSITMLPLGDATATYAVHVVLVGIVSHVFLKEKIRISGIFFSIVSMAGLVFVSRPTFIFGQEAEIFDNENNRTLGIILASVSAVITSGTLVAIRRLTESVKVTEFLFYYAISGIAFTAGYLAITRRFNLPCLSDVLIMCFSSCGALLSATFKTLALKCESAGPVTIVTSTQVIFAFLLDYLIRGFQPAVFSLVGAALILFSCISVTAINIHRNRPHNSVTTPLPDNFDKFSNVT